MKVKKKVMERLLSNLHQGRYCPECLSLLKITHLEGRFFCRKCYEYKEGKSTIFEVTKCKICKKLKVSQGKTSYCSCTERVPYGFRIKRRN